MDSEDLLLVKKSSRGDLDAFEELVRRYENKVYSIAYRFMGNYTDASDLAQEAFLRIYQSLNQYRGEASFLTWIYHITANVCRDELRRRQKIQAIPLDGIATDLSGEFSEVALRAQPEKELERMEVQDEVQRCLSELTDEHRLVLILREIQGFSYEEIADVLKCSIGTVKSRINRARNAFREKISNYQEHI